MMYSAKFMVTQRGHAVHHLMACNLCRVSIKRALQKSRQIRNSSVTACSHVKAFASSQAAYIGVAWSSHKALEILKLVCQVICHSMSPGLHLFGVAEALHRPSDCQQDVSSYGRPVSSLTSHSRINQLLSSRGTLCNSKCVLQRQTHL